MNDILPLQQQPLAGEAVLTINAHDLHAFLGVGKDFSNWVKDRIEQFDFVENQDFVCSPILASKEGRGGHNRMDYFLTLDMAKELAMVERTAKGKEARQYFIQCEKDLRDLRTADLQLDARSDQDLLAARFVLAVKAYHRVGHGSLDAAILAEQALADQGYNLAVLPELCGSTSRKGPWQELLSTIALTPVQVLRPFDDEALNPTVGTSQTTTVLDVLSGPSRHGRTAALQPVGLCAGNIKKVPHLVIPNASTRFAKLVLKGTAWARDGSWLETLADVPGVLMNQHTPRLSGLGALVPLDTLQQAVAWQKLDPRFPIDFPHAAAAGPVQGLLRPGSVTPTAIP